MTSSERKSSYGNDSITSLKGADRVRKRPSVIFGSDGLEGCQHSFFEILSNAIDEAREGYGSEIKVIRHKDLSITVIDYGRGIPVGYNRKEEKHNWELVFCEMYAGGKYDNNTGLSYEYSLGLNGLGLCATQYSSEYMDAEIYYGGKKHILHFKKGDNIGGLIREKDTENKTGSSITWRPDLDVFTDINVPITYYQDVIKKQSIVNAGLKFILVDEETESEYIYCYENGIQDYLKEVNEDKNITEIRTFNTATKGRDRADKPEYRLKMEISFCFNNEINLLEYYHNSSFLEHGGAPDRAVKNALVYELDRYLKKHNKYNKNESKINFSDVQDSLVLIINSFSTITSYENQTKKAITNKFIQEAMTNFLKTSLEVYFIENKDESEKIAAQVLINKRSREQAEKARINIKKKLGGKVDISNRVKKFVDCRSKDLDKREIYIVEGDSALGSCKMGRDADFQAIMPVRGKILNCLKAELNNIFKNDIIMDLLKVLGCGIEIKSKHKKNISTFNLDDLRWNKVIICTDADVDGFQIRTLILAMIYRLIPTVMEKGFVYIAESPLFEINCGKDAYFAYNEQEKQEIINQLEGKKYSLQRSKGLGENDPEMMWETTMNPDSRRLIRVMPEDFEATKEIFDLLLGDNLAGRKDYIASYGHLFMDMLDVS